MHKFAFIARALALEPRHSSHVSSALCFCYYRLFFVPPPEGGREIREHGRTLVPQGRASVGGASAELPRAVAVAVVVPLLLFVVEFASCVASCPGSVDDEVPAAVKQEAPTSGGLRGPTPSGCAACTCPSPPQRWWRRTGCGPPRGPTQ